MDADRFDDVLRQWGSTRRPVLGAGLGALLGLAGMTLGDARKKKKKKKCKAPRVKCGKACCAAGETCQNGACTSPCPAGKTRCNGTCVNTLTDGANCGKCGQVCQNANACQQGKCPLACPAGQISCNGNCVDPLTDGTNCGGCGRVCEHVNACQQGMCPLACPAGQVHCNGPCVNTDSDEANCGVCGTECQAGLSCQGGLCGGIAGTCTAGQDSCAAGPPITCSVISGVTDCFCVKDMSGATVCARKAPNMPCGCETDAECQTREFPADLGGGTYPNAFCLKTASTACSAIICPNNVCVIPCQRFHDGS